MFEYISLATRSPRSFLFCIVANVGPDGASRSLAVAYRQGRDTDRKGCHLARIYHVAADILALIEILSDPANRASLEAERALAQAWYRRSQGDNEARPSVPDAPQPPAIVPYNERKAKLEEQAEAARLRPELPWHYDALSKFPFVTTCLLLGLLRDDCDGDANTTNRNSVRPGDVQLQPLSTVFRADCTEYGLVALDISDLDSGVKYGIVAFPMHYMAEVWHHNPCDWDPVEDPMPEKEPDAVLAKPRLRVPLSIVQLLDKLYYGSVPSLSDLEERPLVDVAALDYIFPREFEVQEDQPEPVSGGVISSISNYFWPPKPKHPRSPPGPGWTIPDPPGKEHGDRATPGSESTMLEDPLGKEHRDRAIDKLLIITQDPADLGLDQNTIGNFQKLAEFREQLRSRLEEVPDSLGPSKVSGHILRVAYAGCMHLNLVAFRNLTPSAIAVAITSDEPRGASALSLCIDNFNLAGSEGELDDLAAALAQSTGLKQLAFLQRPDRDSDNASAHFWALLMHRWGSSGGLEWLRDKTIYLTCAFSSSLCSSKLSSPLPNNVSLTSTVVNPFLEMHMFTFVDDADHSLQKHLNSSNSSYYEDMRNTLLSAERFAVRFILYLRSLGLGSDKAIFRFAYEGAFSSPIIAPYTSDDDDSSLLKSSSPRRFTVSPIPAGHFAPPPEVNVQSRIRVRDIHTGSWVVLVNQKGHGLIEDDDTFIRYAFVRIGQTSDKTAPEQQEQQQRSVPVSVSLEVVGGLTDFLREIVPGIDVSTYDKRLWEVEEELQVRALIETGNHISIGVMDEKNALALLDQIL